ncbi:7ab72536-1713-4090-96d0-0ead2c7b86f8 [Sclerotinia trifoliorum]|uniref:7ab72536-1713-4090-96d0-0ead2c7b86f8 n=1 Tax=Sclerotinia trifoliorum TaxID=28548 RepID=A0A8H2VTB4_9HELO|nr:7ab72536-1713-4090-96d0-0ead2c7b86f8 [Sclerotinia trifoliorum]
MNHPQTRGPQPPPPGKLLGEFSPIFDTTNTTLVAMGRGAPGPAPPPPGFQGPPAGFQGPPPGFQGPSPGFQGPPPGFQGPPRVHQGHPGQGGRAPPPPQMQMPMRPRHESSSHIVDLNATEKRPLDDAACRKLLTTYTVHSIRKVVPTGKEKSTWAKAVLTEEPLSQEDIAAQLKKLRNSPQTIADKKAALFPNQQCQVNRLLDRLKSEEPDQHFDWSLVQLDRKERYHNKVRETVVITVIVKRAVRDQFNAMAIYQLIEKNKQERLAELMRPPMPPQPQNPPPIPPPIPPPNLPPNLPSNPNDEPPAVVGVLRAPGHNGSSRGRSRSRSRSRQMPARYRSDSNSDSESDSDTASTGASTFSSSLATSISSRSDERSRKNSSRSRRGHSHSRHRPREHHKKYYPHKSESPEPIFQEFRRSSEPRPPFVGGVAPITAPDAIAQAFQQGREEERAAAQYYLSQSQRPIIIDDPSRAVVPAGTRELEHNTAALRYPPRRHAEVPMVGAPQYVEPQYLRRVPRQREPLYSDRHLDDVYEDDVAHSIIRSVRPVPQEAAYRRRLSDVENYIARDSIPRRIPFTGLRPQILQVRHHHPFAPRSPPRHRYTSSYSSDSAYT